MKKSKDMIKLEELLSKHGWAKNPDHEGWYKKPPILILNSETGVVSELKETTLTTTDKIERWIAGISIIAIFILAIIEVCKLLS